MRYSTLAEIEVAAALLAEDDMEDVVEAVAAAMRRTWKLVPAERMAKDIAEGKDISRKVYPEQMRNRSATVEDTVGTREIEDLAREVLRGSKGRQLDEARVRWDDIGWLAVLMACRKLAEISSQGSASAAWRSTNWAEVWVRDEILSRGYWNDYDKFVVEAADGPFLGRTRQGMEKSLREVQEIAAAALDSAKEKHRVIEMTNQGPKTRHHPSLTREGMGAAVAITLAYHWDRNLEATWDRLAYAEGEDLVKDLFRRLFIARWKIKGHECITAPETYGDNAEALELDRARMRMHLLAFRQVLWQSKRALYRKMSMENLMGRIMGSIYSRMGNIGKSYFLARLFGPFTAVRQSSTINFRNVVGDRFSTALLEKAALVVDEFDLGEETSDASKVKSIITAAMLEDRDAYATMTTAKRTHATFVATTNTQLSIIMTPGSGKGTGMDGMDNGIARRFWEWPLTANADCKDDSIDFDDYDWAALWKSVNENDEDGPLASLPSDQREEFYKMQEGFVNSTWFHDHMAKLSLVAPMSSEDAVAVRIAKLDEFILKRLQDECLVSRHMGSSTMHKLVTKWISSMHMEVGVHVAKGVNVLLVSRARLHPKLLNGRYVLGGECEVDDEVIMVSGVGVASLGVGK